MAVRRPTLDQLRSVAEDLGMHMGEEELKSYDELMQANYAAYEARKTSTAPGTSRPRSRAQLPANWPAKPSHSRTISASPACR